MDRKNRSGRTDGQVYLFRQGARSHRFGSLEYCEVRLTATFPLFSPILIVRDRQGNSMSITEMYWAGWKALKPGAGEVLAVPAPPDD